MRLAFLTRIKRAFNGETIRHEPLGGTQSALIYLARELAALGHEVFVFCHCGALAGRIDGVDYRPVSELVPLSRKGWDAFVAVADEAALKLGIRAHLTLWWSHNDYAYLRGDQSGLRAEMAALLQQRADKIVAVSQWQAEHLQALLGLPPEHFWVSRNGVCWPYYASLDALALKASEAAPRLLYTSVPDRGLDLLLDFFPELQQRVQHRYPQLELHLYSSFAVWGQNQDAEVALAQDLEARARALPGVFFHAPLPQSQLAAELAKGLLWLYPNHAAPATGFWAETSCIAALEAQAAGLPVLASARGALSETVLEGRTGYLFSGDPYGPLYRERFISTAAELLLQPERLQGMAQAARERIEAEFSWRQLALEWSQALSDLSSTRQNEIRMTVAGHPGQAPETERAELSVIVTTWDRPEALALCLESLCQQDLEPRTFEVVVLDSGPQQLAKSVMARFQERLRLRYHAETWPGFQAARARNLGVQYSRGRVLVFLDGDLLVSAGFLRRHLQAHREARSLLLSSYCYRQLPGALWPGTPGNSPPFPLDAWLQNQVERLIPDLRARQVAFDRSEPVAPQFFQAAACSLRREALKKYGAFDPDFTGWGCEDLEFGLRLCRRGLKLRLLRSEAQVLHLWHPSPCADAATQEAERRRNWQRLCRRHGKQDYVHSLWALDLDLPVALQSSAGEGLSPAPFQGPVPLRARLSLAQQEEALWLGPVVLQLQDGILCAIEKPTDLLLPPQRLTISLPASAIDAQTCHLLGRSDERQALESRENPEP